MGEKERIEECKCSYFCSFMEKEYCRTCNSFVGDETPRSEYQVERLVRRQRLFIEAIKPYVDLRVDIYRVAIPTTTLYQDGRIETKFNFDEKTLKTLKILDECIEEKRKSILEA